MFISVKQFDTVVDTETEDDETISIMDDRESIYMDTISINSHSEVTKKGLSQSRQTIYHSAEDLQPVDRRDDEFFSQEKNNSNKLPIYVGGVGGEYSHPGLNTDEVSARLLLINHKKKTVTYSQWKSRVKTRFRTLRLDFNFFFFYFSCCC